MNTVQKIELWGDSHHPRYLDFIRIVLGLFLLLKGIAFMENSTNLQDLLADQKVVALSGGLLTVIIYYVTFVHLVGGIMITLGILTRFASFMQVPIVLAAVFLTAFFREPINTLAWPSITALVLLAVFIIIGSGPLSLDKYLANEAD